MNLIKAQKNLMFLVIATLIVSICAVVGWTSATSNAMAADESATNEVQDNQANATTHNITFATQGIDSGANINYELYNNNVLVPDFKLGNMLKVEDGATVTYNCQPGDSRATIRVSDSNNAYSFVIFTPAGYDISSCSTSVEKITEDITFTIIYTSNPTPYQINVAVVDSSDQGLEGVLVKFYDPKTSTNLSLITDSSGHGTFSNIPAEKAEGVLNGYLNGYANNFTVVDIQSYKNHIANDTLKLVTVDKANIILNNPSVHHKAFEFQTLYIMPPETVLMSLIVQDVTLSCQAELPASSEWTIDSDGTLTNSYEGELIQKTIVKPISEPGYSLAKWKLNRNNNVDEYYTPGQQFTLNEGEKLNVEPIYDNAPAPGPEPVPTPTEEVTAQTGDSAPLVPFVLLAVLASGVLLYTRKIAQK